MPEEVKLEEQKDPDQRKGENVTKDQTTQTQPMSNQSRNSSSHNKGPVDYNLWHQRRARSLTRQSDRLVHNNNRCRSDGCGVSQFRHTSHGLNWHWRNDRGQSGGRHNEHSSDYDNWCRRRAYNNSYKSDRLVCFSNRPQGDGFRLLQTRRPSEFDKCRCRNDSSQDVARHAKLSDAEDWHKRTAYSLSPQSDRPVHDRNGCHSVGHRASRFRRGSEWEDCGVRSDRSQDGVKHSEPSSDDEKWCKGTAHDSPFQSEQPVIKKDKCHGTVHSGDKFKQASENRWAATDHGRDSVPNEEGSSDADHWHKATAGDTPGQSEQPVIKQDGCNSNVPCGDKFIDVSDWENWCSGNDHIRDECSSDPDNWPKTTAHKSSHGSQRPVSDTSRPRGDGRRFNPFKRASYCGYCHSDCGRDSVKPSDSDNWRSRRAHNSYRPGVHFVISKTWRHPNRYWINPFKRATHVRNWRSRNDRNKNGCKDSDCSSYCKNWRRRNPHGASRYAIWAIFNRKLSHKAHANRQAVAQFKSDCENWRSWNDRHRDHVDQHKQSPEDQNWRSRGDCVRDLVEHCDRSPDKDFTYQGECDEWRAADSNKERKETEVQNMHGSDTGRKVILKTPLASSGSNCSAFLSLFCVQMSASGPHLLHCQQRFRS